MTRTAEKPNLRWAILAVAVVLYIPLIFLGPGSDADSIGVIESGCTLLLRHYYEPSRYPGYFPYEAITGVLFDLGGSTLSNLASVLVSLLALDSFLDICVLSAVPNPYLLAAILAVQPAYWINSTSTIDFVWALSAFLGGYRCMLRGRWPIASLLFGLSIGIRLASGFLVAAALIAYLLERPTDRRLWGLAALSGVVGATLYIPEFIAAGYSFAFLTYYPRAFGIWGTVGRFIYKNIYLWGLPASVLFVVMSPQAAGWLRTNAGATQYRPIIRLALIVIVTLELLFLKLPHQIGYLLPIVPFVLILFGLALAARRAALIAIGLCILSFDFVSINVARPNHPRFATRAQVGLWLESGELVGDIVERSQMDNSLARSANCTDFLSDLAKIQRDSGGSDR